jgi:hypothetical protein
MQAKIIKTFSDGKDTINFFYDPQSKQYSLEKTSNINPQLTNRIDSDTIVLLNNSFFNIGHLFDISQELHDKISGYLLEPLVREIEELNEKAGKLGIAGMEIPSKYEHKVKHQKAALTKNIIEGEAEQQKTIEAKYEALSAITKFFIELFLNWPRVLGIFCKAEDIQTVKSWKAISQQKASLPLIQ